MEPKRSFIWRLLSIARHDHSTPLGSRDGSKEASGTIVQPLVMAKLWGVKNAGATVCFQFVSKDLWKWALAGRLLFLATVTQPRERDYHENEEGAEQALFQLGHNQRAGKHYVNCKVEHCQQQWGLQAESGELSTRPLHSLSSLCMDQLQLANGRNMRRSQQVSCIERALRVQTTKGNIIAWASAQLYRLRDGYSTWDRKWSIKWVVIHLIIPVSSLIGVMPRLGALLQVL